MNKKLIAAAIAAAMAAPAAYADATVYGQLKMQLNHTDTHDTDMSSKGSRLGFKGSEDLGNGLKAIYKLEMGLNMSDGDGLSGTARSQYVGLAGGFGTVMFGTRETNYLLQTSKLDFFGDTLADYNKLIGFNEAGGTSVAGLSKGARPTNAVHYVSPSFSGLTASVGLFTDGSGDFAEDWDASLVYKNGGIHASVGYIDDNLGDSAYRIGLGYKMDAIKVAAVYEDRDSDSNELWQVSGAYTMGNNTLKATYGDNSNGGAGWAIGVDHKMSKHTKVYALYADSDNALNGDNVGSGANSGISLGMQHNF